MKYMVLLASKYVKRQKFRTVLTFLGIMLASFILCSSMIVLNSLESSAKQYIKESIGSWELRVSDDKGNTDEYDRTIEAIAESALVSDYYIIRRVKADLNADEKERYNCYFEVTDAEGNIWNPRFMSIMTDYGDNSLVGEYYQEKSCDLSAENENGIILPRYFRDKGYDKGDSITLTFTPVLIDEKGNSFTRQFVIADFSTEFTNEVFLEIIINDINSFADELAASDPDKYKNEEYINAYIRINDNINFDDAVNNLLASAFNNRYKFQDIRDNDDFNADLLLLEFKSVINPSNIGFLFVVIFAYIFGVWLIARFIIDNTFEISVAERNRKFNVLKTLGASKGQLSALTFFEASFYCLTAVPAGTITAFLILRWLFESYIKAGVSQMVFGLHPAVMAACILLCVVSVFISSYTSALWPTRKMTLVEAMNYGTGVKVKKNAKIKKKTNLHKSPGKLIWTYTKRNIGRTKGKFIFSAFAGSVSVIMIVVVVLMAAVIKEGRKDEYKASVYDFYFSDMSSLSYDTVNRELADTGFFSDIRLHLDRSYVRAVPGSPVMDNVNYISSETADMLDNKCGIKLNSYSYGIINEYDFNRSIDEYFDIFSAQPSDETLASFTGMTYDEFRDSGKSLMVVTGRMSSKFRKTSGNSVMNFDDSEIRITGFCYVKNEYIPEGMECGYILTAAENLSDVHFKDGNLSLKLSDGSHYEEALEKCRGFQNEHTLNFENLYLQGTGFEVFVSVICKTAVVLFVFLWMTSIISMINLTNTRIMNSQREYFIMRCTGMTKKQLVISVILEVIVFSALSTVLGTAAGSAMFSGMMRGMFAIDGTSLLTTGNGGMNIMVTVIPVIGVAVVSMIINIIIPVVFSVPLIRRIFTTSSDVVNSNDIR